MMIGFTGHRNRRTPEYELDRVAQMYPGAEWLHGGAEGFDTQVQRYAERTGRAVRVLRPDWNKYGFMRAPLVRDAEIVEQSDLIVACYDGYRNRGGTYYTIRYAERTGKPIVYVKCVV